jgi:hypothetical protein
VKRLLLVIIAALPAFAATTKTITIPATELRAVTRHTVTIDVKDEDARAILTSMQKQCAVKNLIVDDDVNVRGTFKFRGVPCATAFRVVFQSLGLGATDYGNSTLTVGRTKR